MVDGVHVWTAACLQPHFQQHVCLQLSLMDEGGNTKDDLGLPKGTDDAEKLADQIKKDFDDGKELVVTVLKVGCLFAPLLPGCEECSFCLLSVQAITLKKCQNHQDTNVRC